MGDILFQEVQNVAIRKDPGSPTTHAHLMVKLSTKRLNAQSGSSLLKSFLTNATMATDLMGLTTHEIESDLFDDSSSGAAGTFATEAEESDEYADDYATLEAKAEEKANGGANVAGVDVPDSVPMPAIVAGAGVIVL